ncbi:MAG: hypothetical protein IGS48_03060 [Oscillatoriales cyanobacterium C42_A2020_001]|nr:hypothetical protein [Leptolyngbyaceae cyanobacterium C42_A2020_001]
MVKKTERWFRTVNLQGASYLFQGQWLLLQTEPLASVYLTPPIWTQLLTALVVGLITALALQFLLTNLGIALALSFWRFPFLNHQKTTHSLDEDSNQVHLKNKSPVSVVAGLGILLTVNLVLFSASFLATTFSQINIPISGAIVGLVIWSAYFLLLLWLSSTAVTSLVTVFLGMTTAGFRRILSAITAMFKQSDEELVTQEQMLTAIRQEVLTTISQINLQPMIQERLQNQLQASSQPVESTPIETVASTKSNSEQTVYQTEMLTFWQTLQSFLLNSKAKNLTSKRVERTLQDLLQDLSAKLPRGRLSPAFDRVTIAAILEQRQDLTKKKKTRLLNQMEATWSTWNQEQLADSDLAESKTDSVTGTDDQRSPLFDAGAVSQVVVEAVKDQVIAQLPNLLTQNLSNLVPFALTLTQADNQNLIENITEFVSANDTKTQAEQLATHSQATISDVRQSVTSEVEKWRDRTTEQLGTIQKEAHNRINIFKQQTQQRVEQTRKAAVSAVWWLFAIASTGAMSAGLAGAIAAGLRMQIRLPW